MRMIENTCAKICPVVAKKDAYIAFLEKGNNDLAARNNILRDRVEGLEKRISKIRQQCFTDAVE